jgi:hypothetical protein
LNTPWGPGTGNSLCQAPRRCSRLSVAADHVAGFTWVPPQEIVDWVSTTLIRPGMMVRPRAREQIGVRYLYAREHFYEDLNEHVARHRKLLDLVAAGDPAAVLAELAVHGERSFSELQSSAGNRSDSTS